MVFKKWGQVCRFGLLNHVCWVDFSGLGLLGWGGRSVTRFFFGVGLTGLVGKFWFTGWSLLVGVCWVGFAGSSLLGRVCWVKFSGPDFLVMVCWVRFTGLGFTVVRFAKEVHVDARNLDKTLQT